MCLLLDRYYKLLRPSNLFYKTENIILTTLHCVVSVSSTKIRKIGKTKQKKQKHGSETLPIRIRLSSASCG